MQYAELDVIVKGLDELLVKIEAKLEKERQNLIDSGFDPRIDEYEFWHAFRDIYDAYVADIERVAQVRQQLVPYRTDEVDRLANAYGIDLTQW